MSPRNRWAWKSKPAVVQIKRSSESELWATFEARVARVGLVAKNCGHGHWRIEGGTYEVNWYPFSTRRTIYVNRTTAAATIADGTIDQAIAAAFEAGVLPKIGHADQVKRGKTRGWRTEMLKVDPHCHWCKAALTMETATTDHVVPLARGGINHPSNFVLACQGCNQRRGHGDDWKPQEART